MYTLNSGFGQGLVAQLPFLGSGKHFVVGDSGTANEDMLRNVFGYDPDGDLRFFATIDSAIGECTANAGDTILVMPGHTETIDAAGDIACDVAGISIVGLGNGEDRPILTFDGSDATPSITVSAANVKWSGFILKCNEASLNHMFDLTADDTTIENCDFREGTATPLFFIVADGTDGDTDRLKIKNCRFYCPTAGNGDAAIHIAKDMVGVRIEDCDIYGDWDLGGILVPAGGNACLDLAIRRCRVVNLLTNVAAISISGTSCTGEIADCRLGTDTKATALDNGSLRTYNTYWTDTTDQTVASAIFAEPDSTSNILGANDADNGFDSTNVVSNADGSVLERLETIQQLVGATDGSSNILGANDADNGFDSSAVVANADGSIVERLEDIVVKVTAVDDILDTEFPVVATAVGAVADAALADTIEGAAAATQSVLTDVKGVLQRIGADNADNTAATTLVAANEDGSVLERLEQVQEAVNKGTGTALAADKSLVDAIGSDGTTLTDSATSVVGILGVDDADNAFASTNVTSNRDGSVLERTEAILSALIDDDASNLIGYNDADNNGATNLVTANDDGTIVERLEGLLLKSPQIASKNYANLTGYDDAVAFTVTGDVIVRVWGVVGGVGITSTSGTTTLSVGTTEDVDACLPATTVDNSDFAATDVWVDNNPEDDAGPVASTSEVIVGGGADISLFRSVDDLTAGGLTLYCEWRPLSSDGSVVAA